MAEQFLMGVIGLGGGSWCSSGAAALVIGLGIIPRYAGITRTPDRVLLYEDCAMLGIFLGNLAVLWQGRIPAGFAGLAIFGIFSGIFLGSWVIAPGRSSGCLRYSGAEAEAPSQLSLDYSGYGGGKTSGFATVF